MEEFIVVFQGTISVPADSGDEACERAQGLLPPGGYACEIIGALPASDLARDSKQTEGN